MRPSVIYELLSADINLTDLGITSDRIVESQSVDERPFDDGYFVTISFEEPTLSSVSSISKGPRTTTIAIHHPLGEDRDYSPIDDILNRIDKLLLPVEQQVGGDGVRVTSIRRQGRSGNLIDEGWRTITRTAIYGVLYDEYAA